MLASLFGFSQKNKGFERLMVADFEEKVNTTKNKIILDVRTPQEYNNGHLKKVKLINYYDADLLEELKKLDKDKTVFVYCASGMRSLRAAKKLAKLGFSEVYEMKGGYNAWKRKY